MGSKSKARQTTQNTYGSPAPFSSPATQKLAAMVDQGSDPSIPYHFAQKRQDLNNSYMNPLGAYTSPAVRDAANRVAGERMSMDEAEAIKESNFLQQQAAFDRQAAVVNATMPFQTGGVSTGVQKNSGGWGQIIGAGAGIASSLL